MQNIKSVINNHNMKVLNNMLIQAVSGLIAVENDSGLLLALAILNDSAPMAE